MHNTESILENEIHKFLCDLEISNNHLISSRRPDQEIVKGKREPAKRRTLLSWQTTELNWKKAKEENYPDIAKELKNYGNNCDTNCKLCALYNHQMIS